MRALVIIERDLRHLILLNGLDPRPRRRGRRSFRPIRAAPIVKSTLIVRVVTSSAIRALLAYVGRAARVARVGSVARVVTSPTVFKQLARIVSGANIARIVMSPTVCAQLARIARANVARVVTRPAVSATRVAPVVTITFG